jgi:regulator of replication initiation timing
MKLIINVEEAINALKANLEEHKIELKEAVAEWTRLVLLAMEKYRDAVDREGLKASEVELQQLFYKKPKDTREQYSKYISALERSKATTVEVDEDDCDRIFSDNWDWRVTSKAANAPYSRSH